MERQITATLTELEKRLHDPQVRRSPQDVGELLADSFVEIGSSGRIYDREEIIAELETEAKIDIRASNFRATEISPAVVLLTYRSRIADRETLGESIWLRTDDGWKVVFHRGTPVS